MEDSGNEFANSSANDPITKLTSDLSSLKWTTYILLGIWFVLLLTTIIFLVLGLTSVFRPKNYIVQVTGSTVASNAMTVYLLTGGSSQTAVTITSATLTKGNSFAVVNQNDTPVILTFTPNNSKSKLSPLTLAKNSSVVFVSISDAHVTPMAAVIDRVLSGPPEPEDNSNQNAAGTRNMF
jgi:multisubunit Na+/H+ antiporter MnhC subunit